MVAKLGDVTPRRQQPELGTNAHYIRVPLSPQQQRVFALIWQERLPQTAVAGELRISQPAVSQLVNAIRRNYAKVGATLPKPTPKPRPKGHTGRRYVEPGVVQIDVCRLVNELRGLRKLTRSGSVADSQILGRIVNAIDDDTVLQVVGELVRPAARPGTGRYQ